MAELLSYSRDEIKLTLRFSFIMFLRDSTNEIDVPSFHLEGILKSIVTFFITFFCFMNLSTIIITPNTCYCSDIFKRLFLNFTVNKKIALISGFPEDTFFYFISLDFSAGAFLSRYFSETFQHFYIKIF